MPQTSPGVAEALRRRRAQQEAVDAYDRMIEGLGPEMQETIRAAGANWWVKPSVLVDLIENAATEEDLNFVGGLALEIDDEDVLGAAEERLAEIEEIARKEADEGFQWGDIADPVRGAVRLAGSAIESGWQEAQGVFRGIVAGASNASEVAENGIPSGFNMQGGQPNPRLGSNTPAGRFADTLNRIEGEGFVGSQSTFGITVGKLFSGEISPGEVLFGDPDALGSGYMSGGAVAEEQRSRAFRSANIDGRSLTPGRLVASFVSEPGESAHKWLSGSIDAGLVTFLDPANVALGAVGRGVQARRYFQPEEGRRLLGLVGGQRATVTEAASNWLTSTWAGGQFVGRLAKTADPVEIWEMSRRQIPVEWATRLADESDPDAIRDIALGFLGTDVARKPKGWHYTRGGVAVRNFTVGNPLFGQMPRSGLLDTYDPDAFVTQIADELKNARVPEDEIKSIVGNAMRAMSDTTTTNGIPLASDRYAVLSATKDAVAAQLKAAGVKGSRQGALTRIWDGYEALRRYNIDALTGHEKPLPYVVANGLTEQTVTPQALEQLLSRYVPMPDARTVREISRRTGRIARLPGGQEFRTATLTAGLAFDALSRVWKPLQLIRPAYILRVVGDEQARMAAAGMSSTFSSPLAYFALAVMDDGRLGKILDNAPGVTVGRYGSDVTGKRFTTQVDRVGGRMEAVDDESDIAQALYTGSTDLLFGEKTRKVPGFISVRRGEEGFFDAWLDEVQFLRDNQIARRIAAGEPIDDIKEWYWTSGYRRATIGSADSVRFAPGSAGAEGAERLSPLAKQVETRAGSDEYVEHMMEWVQDVTQGDAGLLEGVATGRVGGSRLHRNTKPTKEALDYVQGLGVSPEYVRGAPQLTRAENAAEIYRATVDLLMDVIAVRPSNWASRSPTFRQSYWKRIEDLLDLATPEARRGVIERAAVEAKLPKDAVKRLKAIEGTGTLELEDLNALAGQYAADETKRLLYDLHNRSRFFDAARLIFPFGEAWREVITTWGRLLSENPKALRTLQRGITGAKGDAGIIYRDETTGEDMFSIPGSKALVRAFAGVDADFRATTAGLSIAGSVIPGVGPAVQWGVGTFLPDKPEYKMVRDFVFQFGGEDEGVVKTFTPGWVEKLQKWASGPESDKQFNAAIGHTLNALASTGDYDLQDPEDIERLQDDAVAAARRVFLLRGLLQAVAPSAPQPGFTVETERGDMAGASLRKAFAQMQAADYESAVENFVDRFGPQALIAAVPFTQMKKDGKNVYGIRATRAFNDFQAEHSGLFDLYPRIAGLFGPQDDGYDFQVYERQFREHGEVRSPNDRLADMNDMLGRLAFDHYKSQLPANPSRAQSRWLAQVRSELEDAYPGYNPKDFNLGDVSGAINDMERAVEHESVEDLPITNAIADYFRYRAKAVAAAPAGSQWQQSKESRHLRDWLRQVAQELSTDTPEFRRVWDVLLSRELKDDLDEEG